MARAVLTAGLAIGASLALALPAQAHGARQPVTCNGTIGATTVGNVVVADGTSCVLTGTKVKGSVTVGVGAVLDMSDVTVYYDVTSNGARVTATDSSVGGSFTHTGGGQVRLTDTYVDCNVTISSDSAFSASGLAVGGKLTGTNVGSFDVSGSYVGKALLVDGAANGANLCGNWVRGNTSVLASGGAVLLGGSSGSCAGNTVGGGVAVDNNVAYIEIAGNTVRRNLSCTGNEPAPVVGTNTVSGTKLGQCA